MIHLQFVPIIFGGKNTSTYANMQGDVQLHVQTDTDVKKVKLTNAYYVPDARHSLVSTTA